MARELNDHWTVILACVHDQEWLWTSLAIDQYVKSLKAWKAAVERMILG